MVLFPNYTDATIVFNGQKPLSVECHVISVLPNPSVKIWVGNTDLTQQFSKEVQKEVGSIPNTKQSTVK